MPGQPPTNSKSKRSADAQSEDYGVCSGYLTAPFNIALYPPPDTATPMFGSALTLLLWLSMYWSVFKPVMFIRERKSRIGWIVAFLRTSNHAVSLGDRLRALRIVGVAEGQSTVCGV